jgi:hypothetical protein
MQKQKQNKTKQKTKPPKKKAKGKLVTAHKRSIIDISLKEIFYSSKTSSYEPKKIELILQ